MNAPARETMTTTHDETPAPILIRRRASPGEGEAVADSARLTVTWDLRQRSRFRARLDDGREVGVVLPRGGVLRNGDRLASDCGLVVEVRAAEETLSEARTPDPGLFARACYHMGNRHVPLQVGPGWMRFQPDHVLGAMLQALGLELARVEAPFDPEAGAYGGGHAHGGSGSESHGHHHGHDHGHDYSHDHSHDHRADQAQDHPGPRIHRMGEAPSGEA